MARRTATPLRVQTLEARENPAGNIQAALEGSFLTLFGDALDNQVRVTQTATAINVVGLTGTLVNGLPSVSFLTPAVNAIEVKLDAGSDQLIMNNVRPANDLFIEAAAGNDVVTLNNASVGGNLTVELGQGTDRLTTSNLQVGVDANVKGEGAATANLNLASLIGQSLSFTGATGNGRIAAANLTLGGAFNASTDAPPPT